MRARADAEILGIQISAKGRLVNPQLFQPGTGNRAKMPGELLARIAGWIQQGRISIYLIYSFVTLLALLMFIR